MEFQNEDLLTLSELTQLATNDLPNARAKIIASKLKKYCFIRQEGDKSIYYRIQDNVVYSAYRKDITEKVKLIQSQFIETSYSHLGKKDKKALKKEADGVLRIYKNSIFSEYDSQLIELLTIDYTDTRMKAIDNTPYETHYKNGYYDAKDEQFKPRIFGTHYVTKVIGRDYVPSTEKQRKKVLNIVRKIYFLPADFEAIMMLFGSTLSGAVAMDQTSLMLIGDGSAGKSFIMELTLAALECYVMELSSDTFVLGNTKKDKILNSLLVNPQCRYLWLNEFKDAKLDEAGIKDVIDGKFKTTSLYEDGLNVFKINAKIFGTMNTIPNFIADGGMTRRIDSFEHKAKFVNDDNLVDEKNHVYKTNKKMLVDIIEMDLLNAWFDILIKYCVKWINGEQVVYTDNFKESKQLMVGSNDKVQDFIDSKICITGDETNRISKDSMRNEFLKCYPDKHTTVPQIIMLMKQKKLEYNSSLRIGDIRGAFTGVKWKVADEESEQEAALEQGVDKRDQSVKYVLQTEYEELESKYKELLESLKPKPKVIQVDEEEDEVPKKKIKKVKPSKSGDVEKFCNEGINAGDNIEQAFGKYL